MDIQRWDFIEIAHEATAEREYPFRFVDFDATFTHIDSGHSVNISGYYDGDATWRLRFMPTELGTWRYLTSSNTPGLDGHEGRAFRPIAMCYPCSPTRSTRSSPTAAANTTPAAIFGPTRWASTSSASPPTAPP
jgi:hypothetical protein